MTYKEEISYDMRLEEEEDADEGSEGGVEGEGRRRERHCTEIQQIRST